MRMRWKPLRGEKYPLEDGTLVTVLEEIENGSGKVVSVVLPTGKTTAVPKSHLKLPVIDTKNYEKFQEETV